MQTERRVAANTQIKPTVLACESAGKAASIHNRHRHLLSLLSPKADTDLHLSISRSFQNF